MNRPIKIADALVDRLTHGHDRHSQRWHLHVPRTGESVAEVRPLLVLLGLPTFGLAFAISVLTTYGPVILIHLVHSPTVVGALIGGEGAFALVVPLTAGAISDELPPSPLGRRFPFVVVGAPLAAVALALFPFGSSIGLAGAAVLAFFVGYYLYYPPYRALYADLLPRSLYARAQAGQAIARGAGLGMAPLAGWLADRVGLVRTMRLTSFVYGAGLLIGVVPHTLTPLLIGLPVVALAGAVVLTLPQALAFTLAPEGSEGAAAGLQDFSRGLGVVLGPVVVGAAVGISRSVFGSTHGYA